MIVGEIQRCIPYLFLSNLEPDKQHLHGVLLLPRDGLNLGLNSHGLDCRLRDIPAQPDAADTHPAVSSV